MAQRPGSMLPTGALLLPFALCVHCGPVVGAASYCNSAGPPCGLSIDYEDGILPVGTYAIVVDTPEGVTTCDYEVPEPSRDVQTADEARKQDEALVECGENGTCPEPCSGPEVVRLHRGGLTIDGDAEELTITVEHVETGALAEATFAPNYAEHPKECAGCVIASDTMPLPASE